MEEETQQTPVQQPVNVNINLSLDEVNFILAKLAKLPLEEVIQVFEKIRNQAIQQVQSQEPLNE